MTRFINDPPPKERAANIAGIGCGVILAALAVSLVISFLAAWPVMVLLGVLASWTGWPVAIGYWTTWLILVIVRLAMPVATGSSSS